MVNRYFLFSGVLHVLLAGFLLIAIKPVVKQPIATYTIDFLGASFQAPMSGVSDGGGQDAPKVDAPVETAKEPVKEAAKEAPKEAAKPAADKKAYAAKSQMTTKAQKTQKKIVLGAPSILADEENAAKKAGGKSGPGGGDSGAIGVKTDLPNFPYPWYITQVRNALWTEWEKRKPRQVVLAALVSFALQKDGSIRDVKISKSSGSQSYDYAAKASVDGAAPFPPLPQEFDKAELTVTVEFRDEGDN